MRIGQGFDAHKFKKGDHIILGGITIPHDKGMAAHSDGDVLIHALCDALLGAMSLGDIGQHFPDSSEDFKGIDILRALRSFDPCMPCTTHTMVEGSDHVFTREVTTCACGVN